MSDNVSKQGIYNVIGGALRVGVGIVTLPLLIRSLGIDEYGLWTLAYAVVGTFGLVEGGLSIATTVFISEDLQGGKPDELSKTLTVTGLGTVVLSTLATVVLLIAAPAIVNWFPQLPSIQQERLTLALQLGSLVVWCKLVQQLLIAVEQAYQRYDSIAFWNLIQALFLNLGMLGLVWYGGKTVELMAWQVVCAVSGFLVHLFIVKSLLAGREVRLLWSRTKSIHILRYSGIVWLNYLGGVLFTRLDRIIVGNILGQTALGVYGAITDIAIQINLLSAMAVQPIVTIVSNYDSENTAKYQNLKYQAIKLFKLNVLIVTALGGGCLILSPAILTALFPKIAPNEVLIPFSIAILVYAIYAIGVTGYYLVMGIKKISYICTIVQILASIASLICIAIGSHYSGLVGAMLGNSCYMALFLLNFIGMGEIGVRSREWIPWASFSIGSLAIAGIISIVFNPSIVDRISWLSAILIGVSMYLVYTRKLGIKLGR